MDTCYIFGVSGVLLECGHDGRRAEIAGAIGELMLAALESAGNGPALNVPEEMRAGEVRLLCDPDVDELATYVWSGGRMYELDATPDNDLRETLDSVEREVVLRWKRSHPGYALVLD